MNGDPKPSPPPNDFSTMTSSALLEQLVYIDNFMNNPSSATDNMTPNMDIDGQLSMDLAAFADDSFIFPDEEKKHGDGNDHDHFNPVNFGDDVFGSPKHPLDVIGASGLKLENDGNTINTSSIKTNGTANGIINHSNSAAHNGLNNDARLSLDYLIPDLNKLPKFPVPPGAKNSLVQVGLTTNQIELLSALIAQHQSTLKLKPLKQLLLQLVLQLLLLLQQQVRQHNHIPGLDLSLDYLASTSATTPSLINTPPNASSVSSYSSNNSRQSQVHVATLPSQKMKVTNTASTLTATGSTNTNANLTPSNTGLGSVRQSMSSALSAAASVAPSLSRKHLHAASVSLLESLPLSSGLMDSSAELDKRRRNTAALARFRVKKKLKEKQMENKITQLSDLIESLENKIQHLETENKVLRTLIIEKGEQRNDDELKLLKERATNNE